MSSELQDRLITFEVGGSLYALPIACVMEVAEVEPLACIPTLPRAVAGVTNHHGDALPVLRRSALLPVTEEGLPEPTQVLVVSARPSGRAELGLPVDRISGLVGGRAAVARGSDPVAERTAINDRLAFVLDPARLVERARSVVEDAVSRRD